MSGTVFRRAVLSAAMLVAGVVVGAGAFHIREAHAAEGGKVFEMRTYTAQPGKLDALNARFRDHTLKFFEKHHMKNVGYWMPTEGETAGTTLVYVISHDSREKAKQNWAAFREDAEIRKVFAATEANGKLVSKVESVFLEATDYSPLK
jgi:hypothetical protein